MSDPEYLPFEKLITPFFEMPENLTWVYIVVGAILLTTWSLVNQLFAPYIERKTMGRQQKRRGPSYVGPFGVLQIPADTLKLLIKEDNRPVGSDRTGFFLSVFAVTASAIMAYAPLPWGAEGLTPGNMTIGFLYVFAVFSVFPPMMLIGGWASNSKYSLIGGFRSAGQLIAYEIPMLVSILGIVATVGSFDLNVIVAYQVEHGWFIFRYWGIGAFAGLVFLLCGIAETERIPFDVPEDEASLVMGPRTEFASWRMAALMMVEYLHLWANGLLVIYFFVGGYDLLPIPGWNASFESNGLIQFIALSIKVYGIVFIAAWMRSALARFRIDQFLVLGWKYLLPISIVILLLFLLGKDVNLFDIPWPL
ncbi:MAG: NADH-quinone oxidoreductase subunit H [Candidatus Heimdallarchaeota archaeon]|nr:NADH-quinone oxidoreductase subunit H [Candidatus Heimdallarchaeota archaeon]